MSQPEMVKRITFVVFTETPEEQKFETWPQHLTIFPPVYVPRDIGLLVLKDVTGDIYEFNVTLGEAGKLSGKDVRFFAPGRSTELVKGFHRQVSNSLQTQKNRGVDISAAEFIGQEYLPHITQKSYQPELLEGQELKIDHLALVERIHAKPDIQEIVAIKKLKTWQKPDSTKS